MKNNIGFLFKKNVVTVITFFVITFFLFLILAWSTDPTTSVPVLNDPLKGPALIETYHLKDNAFARYFHYWGAVIQDQDFGPIFGDNNGNANIPELFFKPFILTFTISTLAFIFSFICGIGLGVWAAYKINKIQDLLISFFVVLIIAIPSLALAPLVIFITDSLNGYSFYEPNKGIGIHIQSLLPAFFILVLSSLASVTYVVKNDAREVFQTNYYITAVANGLSKTRIFFSYILKNLMFSLLKLIPVVFLGNITGSILIESIFKIPGNSSVIAQAIKNGEFFIIVFAIFFYLAFYFLLVIIIDIILFFVNPTLFVQEAKNSQFWIIKIQCYYRRKKQVNND